MGIWYQKTIKFKVGQRVRPSQYGKEHCIFTKTRLDQTGVVVKIDPFGAPSILWEGRKTPKRYFAGFIEPDRRRS